MSLYSRIVKRLKKHTFTHDDWFKTICNSYSNPPVFYNGLELPGFPPDQIQINTTGQTGINTLKEAFIFYQDCAVNFKRFGNPIQKNKFLLDFGVGWGRITRFFLRELPLKNIFGIDVMEDFIKICNQTFRSNNFYVTTPFPPTQLPSEKFNFIIGYSVFSHLSESACSSWMCEFNRILAPGGMVALTTRGRHFFDYCESLKGKDHKGYLGALSNLFDDFSDARIRYDQGEFVHSNINGVAGGGAMNSDFYGESFIPEKYAKTAYEKSFLLLNYLFNPTRQTHPIMFFKKSRNN